MTHKKGEMLSKAIHIATNAHHLQFDKGGKPYILHCFRVMNYLDTDDEELQCMALLHDVAEDTKISFKEMKDAGMSDRVISGIRLVTKMQGQTFEEYKELVMSTVDSMKVKKADLTDNSDIRRLKGISEKDIERTVKYQRFYWEIEAKLKEMEK